MEAGYENITVARHLGLPDLEMLQFVHSQITPGRLLSWGQLINKISDLKVCVKAILLSHQ